MDYTWPRDNLHQYKFDADWPNDVKPEDIVIGFTSWVQENEYRISQRNRFIAIAAANKRDREQAFRWNFRKRLYTGQINHKITD